ncbi:MAG TPA: hypothetical protein VKB67_13895 [Rhizomicrobium sp.]|nr:hypothetical protein [Rhizomicrobium sp.]
MGWSGSFLRIGKDIASRPAQLLSVKALERQVHRGHDERRDSSGCGWKQNKERIVSVAWRIAGLLLAFLSVLPAGCSTPYLSDTYATSTPKLEPFDASELARSPVAVLPFVSPDSLQGFSPTLSQALSAALIEVAPPIREISTDQTLNLLTDQGLATEYTDLRSGFARNGILERQRLQRIGAELGSRYVLLPGLAQFEESILDKFEVAGWKFIRNRVTTLRLWLQLWDTQNGHIVWESSGEITVATVFLSPKQTVALEETAKKLFVRMIQDELIGSKTQIKTSEQQ